MAASILSALGYSLNSLIVAIMWFMLTLAFTKNHTIYIKVMFKLLTTG